MPLGILLARVASVATVAALCDLALQSRPQEAGFPAITSSSGLRLIVAAEHTQPALRILLPGRAESDRTIEILFPEHVTGRRQGRTDAEQLYLFRPGSRGERPSWRQAGSLLEYEMPLTGAVQILARATLEDDGVRVHYQFRNRSDVPYDMVYTVTDPRLTSIFHDIRLERTFVHHGNGFDLLASETPGRLSMPLNEWLPSRYRASFLWPVPRERVERPGDGITYYNKSRAIDEPFIATLSEDRLWVVASFAREPGNVWSNPALTCQHVDPQVPLPPNAEATAELKILVLRGSLDDARTRVLAQRASLK